MSLPTKEEAEAKYTTAAHDNPKRAYGRGYLRAIQELNAQAAVRTTAHHANTSLAITEETVDEFIEMAKSDGIIEAEKWFKRTVKAAMDRAMLGTRETTRVLLESYVADVKRSRP